jgi:hypothetical protein
MYYEQFRKEEGFCTLDKDPFVRKPIENEELIKNKHNKQPGQILTISKVYEKQMISQKPHLIIVILKCF